MWVFLLKNMFRIQIAQVGKTPHQSQIATIGNFDGLHLGHVELLEQMTQQAMADSAWRVLITFDILPHEYFADKQGMLRAPRIGLLRDKIAILKQHNLVDEVIILHFNDSIARLSPYQFIRQILQERLDIHEMIVGHDFRFGHLAKGTIHDLRNNGIVTREFAELRHNQVRVSSSLIRELAAEQNIALINRYLGRNIQYTSRVVYGNQLGRKYGVPTINLNLRKTRPVLWGIYTGYVYIEGVRYNGVISIGKNPTVSEGKVYKVEAHLLDVDLHLYNKIACVEILHYLRAEIKFEDLDSLFKQIHKDMSDAREFFSAREQL